MEPVVAARVNDTLEKIRRSKAALEARSEELSKSTAESERQIMEWAREVITIDHRHLSAFISGVSELEGTFSTLSLKISHLVFDFC